MQTMHYIGLDVHLENHQPLTEGWQWHSLLDVSTRLVILDSRLARFMKLI